MLYAIVVGLGYVLKADPTLKENVSTTLVNGDAYEFGNLDSSVRSVQARES